MSEIRVNNIIDEAGTGAPTLPNGVTIQGNTTGTNLTLSGNLTVNGTTTTIDTAVTAVDSLAVDGNITGAGVTISGAGSFGGKVDVNNELHVHRASTTASNALLALHSDIGGTKTRKSTIRADGSSEFSGSVRVNHSGNAGSDQLARLGNVNNSGNNSAHLFLANGYYVSPTAVDGTGAAAKILADGTIHDSIGPLRRLGIQAASGSFSFAADMAGKLVRSTGNGSTLTIPQNVFSAGDMISVFNVSTGNNTIETGAGTTLYNTADGATGNRTLAAKGVCTILCTSTNEFIISGSQISQGGIQI